MTPLIHAQAMLNQFSGLLLEATALMQKREMILYRTVTRRPDIGVCARRKDLCRQNCCQSEKLRESAIEAIFLTARDRIALYIFTTYHTCALHQVVRAAEGININQGSSFSPVLGSLLIGVGLWNTRRPSH